MVVVLSFHPPPRRAVHTKQEEWRPIVGYEGVYEVSSLGRVKSLARSITKIWRGTPKQFFYREKIKKIHKEPSGLCSVVLHKNGHNLARKVHVLVAAAFIGKRPKGMDTIHRNRDRSDNRPENLKYVAPRVRYDECLIHDEVPRRSRHYKTKLTEDDVAEIHRLKGTMSQRKIAARFGCQQQAISRILNGTNWKPLPTREELAALR